MAEFGKAFARTVGLEGGYSDDEDDSGGPTRYGITQAEARAAGYTGDMREFPITLAQSIYRDRYWRAICGDAISRQSWAEKLFDTAVNVGIVRAVRWLQFELNVLNDHGKLWPDQLEDGVMGPITISCLDKCLALDESYRLALARGYVGEQAHYYSQLGKDQPKDETFEHGWLAERCWLPE